MTARGLIFDYGGTLDTGGHHWGRIFWKAYQEAGLSVGENRFREAYVEAERTLGRTPIIQPSYTFHDTLKAKIGLQFAHLKAQGCPLTSGEEAEVLALSYDHARRHTALSREVLHELHDRFPMVLVSNFYGNIATVLREFGLSAFFPQIIESAVVGIRKPDAHIFTLGVEALGLNPAEVVVIGDSIEKDIRPAKSAGCQTVWTKGLGWTDETPDASAADAVISSLSELPALLNPPSPATHHPTPITHHPTPNTHHPSPNTHHPSPNP